MKLTIKTIAAGVSCLLGGVLSSHHAHASVPAECQALGASSADVLQSAETSSSAEISALAQSLEQDPRRILEYVTNEIAYRPDDGSVLGAHGTLLMQEGNAIDHASLLIALLRESGYPARYVRGRATFNFNDDNWVNWLQGEDGYDAFNFALNLLPGTLSTGENVSIGNTSQEEVFIPHVWVQACVPYDSYRGSKTDTGGYRWIPMDASFKQVERFGEAIDRQQEYNIKDSANAFDTLLPLEEEEAKDYSSVNFGGAGGTDLDQLGYSYEQIIQEYPVLPSSLPYRVKDFLTFSNSNRSDTAVLPDDMRVKLEISVKGKNASNQIQSRNTTLNLYEVATRRLSLSFRGVSSTDEARLEWWRDGNPITSCPAGSPAGCACDDVTMVPELLLEGADITPAGGNLAYCRVQGNTLFGQPIEWGLTVRLGSEIRNTIVSGDVTISNGGYETPLERKALMVYPQSLSDKYIADRVEALIDTVQSRPALDVASGQAPGAAIRASRDATIGEFLYLAGIKWFKYVQDAEDRVKFLNNVYSETRYNLGQVTTKLNTDYLLDMPYALTGGNLLIDIPGGKVIQIAKADFDRTDDSFELLGAHSSALESYIWQEMTTRDAVSTVRGLKYAKAANIPIREFKQGDEGIVSSQLVQSGPLAYPANFVSQVIADVSNGASYILPASQLDYNEWKGMVFYRTLAQGGFTNNTYGIQQTSVAKGGYTVGPPLTANAFNSALNNPIYQANPVGYVNETVYDFNGAIAAAAEATINGGITNTYYQPNDELANLPTVTSGNSYYTTYAGDPVNMVSGNLWHEETDIHIKGRAGMDFMFKRSYNSTRLNDGPFGQGWTHSFYSLLIFDDFNHQSCNLTSGCDTTQDNITSSMHWQQPSGAMHTFGVNGASSSGLGTNVSFSQPDSLKVSVQRLSGNRYLITETQSGMKYEFTDMPGANGRVNQAAYLTKITDKNGNGFTLGYDNKQRLISITDSLSRRLELVYGLNSPRIEAITDWTGRRWAYRYSNDQLISALSPLALQGQAAPVNYSYYTDADGPNMDNKLKTISTGEGDSMYFEYYANGQVFRHTDAEGQFLTFTYNPFRRESITTDNASRTERYFFDKNGNQIKKVDAKGNTWRFEYGHPNPLLMTKKTNPLGHETSFEYSSSGQLTRITQPNGAYQVLSQFGCFGQAGKIRNHDGVYQLIKYDGLCNVTDRITLRKGVGGSVNAAAFDPQASAAEVLAWEQLSYDNIGNLTRIKTMRDFANAVGPEQEFVYDPQGLNNLRVIKRGDLDGNGTITGSEYYQSPDMQYDSLGRQTVGLSDSWYVTQTEYDDNGRVKRATDENNQWVDYSYDKNGRIKQTQLKVGNITWYKNSITRDKVGRVVATKDKLGGVTSSVFDSTGLIKSATNEDGYTTKYAYDELKNEARVVSPGNVATITRSDALGRSRYVIASNGAKTVTEYYGAERNGLPKTVTLDADNVERIVSYDYDIAGRLKTVTDPQGNSSTHYYDDLGRTIATVGPVYLDAQLNQNRRIIKALELDAFGRITKVCAGSTDTAGSLKDCAQLTVLSQSVYDDFNRLLESRDGAGNLMASNQYNAKGELIQSTDALGQTISFTYYYGGKLASMDPSGSNNTITYQYNALGLVTSITGPSYGYAYQYDALNRLASVTDTALNKTLSYKYSAGGQLLQMTDSEGGVNRYIYDSVGRLSSMVTPQLHRADYLYNKYGRLNQLRYSNGTYSIADYLQDGSVKSLEHYNAIGNVVAKFEYDYDNLGRVKETLERISNPSGTGDLVNRNLDYDYDNLGRLLSVSGSDGSSETYAYDAFGNRRTYSDGSQTYFYNYDMLQRGRLTDVRTGSASGTMHRCFSYDAVGNVTAKYNGACSGTPTLSFGYNSQHQTTSINNTSYQFDDRGRQIVKGTERFLFNGENATAVYPLGNSSPSVQTTYGPGVDSPFTRTENASVAFYHSERLNHGLMVTDGQGSVDRAQAFTAFGAIAYQSGTIPEFGFTGREPEYGLVNMRARWYDPEIGRFLQPDPLGMADGVNLYAYVGNNPVGYIDPFGTTRQNPSLLDNPAYATFSSALHLGLGVGSMVADAVSFGTAGGFFDGASAGLSIIEGDYAGAAVGLGAAALPVAAGGIVNSSRRFKKVFNVGESVSRQFKRRRGGVPKASPVLKAYEVRLTGGGLFKGFKTPGGGMVYVSDNLVNARDVENVISQLPKGSVVDIFSGTHGNRAGLFVDRTRKSGQFASDGALFISEDVATARKMNGLGYDVEVFPTLDNNGVVINPVGEIDGTPFGNTFSMSGGQMRTSLHKNRVCIMAWCYSEKNPSVFLNYNAPPN